MVTDNESITSEVSSVSKDGRDSVDSSVLSSRGVTSIICEIKSFVSPDEKKKITVRI